MFMDFNDASGGGSGGEYGPRPYHYLIVHCGPLKIDEFVERRVTGTSFRWSDVYNYDAYAERVTRFDPRTHALRDNTTSVQVFSETPEGVVDMHIGDYIFGDPISPETARAIASGFHPELDEAMLDKAFHPHLKFVLNNNMGLSFIASTTLAVVSRMATRAQETYCHPRLRRHG